MKWHEMSEDQQYWTLRTMEERGGGFVSALGTAWQRADQTNSRRLALAFPELIRNYGPESDLHIRPVEAGELVVTFPRTEP